MQNLRTELVVELHPGKVPAQYFRILTDISPIRSKKVIKALHEHFVEGRSRVQVSNEHSVCQGYLSLKIRELHLLNRRLTEIIRILTEKSNIQCTEQDTTQKPESQNPGPDAGRYHRLL